MKRNLAIAIALLAFATAGFAQTGHPAAKATAAVGNITQIDFERNDSQAPLASPWISIGAPQTIKTSEQKDLFVNVGVECGLLTDTLVRSKNGTQDTSSAHAAVQVRVVVDGNRVFEPGAVNYCRRTQTLSAKFLGLNCTADLTTGVVTCADPEELQLILDTMNANAFNFVLDDLGSGVHSIDVQARVDLSALAQEGSARARAYLGKGAWTIEEVRMIKGEDFTF